MISKQIIHRIVYFLACCFNTVAMMTSCVVFVMLVFLPCSSYIGRYHIMAIIILGVALLLVQPVSNILKFAQLWQPGGHLSLDHPGNLWLGRFQLEGVDLGNNYFISLFLFISSVRSSNSHNDLLLIHHHPTPTFSDHTGPQHWTFTF